MCHIVNLRLAKVRRGMLQQRPGAEYRPQKTVPGLPGVQPISVPGRVGSRRARPINRRDLGVVVGMDRVKSLVRATTTPRSRGDRLYRLLLPGPGGRGTVLSSD